MIQIFVDIDGDEFSLDFIPVIRNNITYWEGNSPVPEEGVTIPENGDGLDESNMTVSLGISTPPIVIFERFKNALAKYKEQVTAGIEPTEDDDKSIVTTTASTPQPYNPDDIKVRREGFSVFEINRMMTEVDDIDLNPEFQRNLVWDNSRKSALIESILLGIPIPVFYFAESKSGKYHVVDGLQRLSTIKQFLSNCFPLKNLEHLRNECEGKYYKADLENRKIKDRVLERKYTRRLENAQLIVNVIESASPQKVKYDIFKRLNTGGRPLNHQEIRNCIAENHVRKFLKEAAFSPEFLSATGGSVSDVRMDAQELVLRFAAFRLSFSLGLDYSGDMNSFLDNTLDFINDFTVEHLNTVSIEFKRAMRINFHLFGDYCFRKCLSEHLIPNARKQNINKALFVSFSQAVLGYDENMILSRIQQGSFASRLAVELDGRGDYYRVLTTGTSDTKNLIEAFRYATELLNKYL